MSTVLMQASSQWSSRPADQSFSDVKSLHDAVMARRNLARTAQVDLRSLNVEVMASQSTGNPTVGIRGQAGRTAELTHWSFGQLCARTGSPAGYLRELPAELAVRNLNHRLQEHVSDERRAGLLFEQNGEMHCRAITGPDYTRIWDADITSRLVRLQEQNPEWQPAPAAFDGRRGLYASDHDIFVFMVNNTRRIFEKDPNGGLGRGFMVSNGECGDRSFWLMSFLYEYVCGNHRVWGATGVKELRIRHIGNADDRAFSQLVVLLKEWSESSPADEEQRITRAKQFVLGKTKDEVLDKVFGLRGLSKRAIGQAYDLAVVREDWYGAPNTAWGLAGGLTEMARNLPHGDERVAMDRAAGKVMEIAF